MTWIDIVLIVGIICFVMFAIIHNLPQVEY